MTCVPGKTTPPPQTYQLVLASHVTMRIDKRQAGTSILVPFDVEIVIKMLPS